MSTCTRTLQPTHLPKRGAPNAIAALPSAPPSQPHLELKRRIANVRTEHDNQPAFGLLLPLPTQLARFQTRYQRALAVPMPERNTTITSPASKCCCPAMANVSPRPSTSCSTQPAAALHVMQDATRRRRRPSSPLRVPYPTASIFHSSHPRLIPPRFDCGVHGAAFPSIRVGRYAGPCR
ncbi:hypothetical protein FA95DRAFT_1140581 [Auriscalpium vulgare]|uniref:Uncharacterized protein n=1 Tax=Auriscalpium vulgare TaxID=40419 RepID=A0ACB8RUK0_9AGAM|nr:hypothetical protein FA95DRAFT_1140581 [Auriscalpium vulgare]